MICTSGTAYTTYSDPYYYDQGCYYPYGSTCGTAPVTTTCTTPTTTTCGGTYVNDCGRTCGYVCGCGEVAIDSNKPPTCNEEAPKLDVEKLMTPEFKEKVEKLRLQSASENAKLDIIVQDDTPAENLLSM